MFWKIFFVVDLMVISTSLVVDFLYPEYSIDIGFDSLVQYISFILGAVAIFGLAFKKVIFNKHVWRVLFPLFVATDIIYPAVSVYIEREEVFKDIEFGIDYLSTVIIVFTLVYVVTYFVGLFKYVVFVSSNNGQHITSAS